MTKLALRIDSILVLPSDPFFLNEAAPFQIRHNPLYRPLGDPNFQRDFPQHGQGVPRQEHQHVGVIR